MSDTPPPSGISRLTEVLNSFPGFVLEAPPLTLRCKADGWSTVLPVTAQGTSDDLADAIEAAAADHIAADTPPPVVGS